MSAAVCGSKRAFFEEIPSSPSSPPISKRLRCSSSTSPIRFSQPSLVDQLRAIFPLMDAQLLERTLEECGNNLDAAIKSLSELCLGTSTKNLVSPNVQETAPARGTLTNNEDAAARENPSAPSSLPTDGAEWVDLFVKEMMSASSIDDARIRTSRALEGLEKSISARASAEMAQTYHKENMHLKEQIEILVRDNTILKKAVAIQHERHKETEQKEQELQHMRPLLSQYQEQVRTLEVNNYALTMHLKQAQQSSSIPGRFNPDVF